jgi:hypothetical protein
MEGGVLEKSLQRYGDERTAGAGSETGTAAAAAAAVGCVLGLQVRRSSTMGQSVAPLLFVG